MKGMSIAHQATPRNGNQINCCLMKNFRNGMRRLSTVCNATISIQVWWFTITRYQCGPQFLEPRTSNFVELPTARIRAFIVTQLSPIAMIQRVIVRRKTRTGTSNFRMANSISGMNQNRY